MVDSRVTAEFKEDLLGQDNTSSFLSNRHILYSSPVGGAVHFILRSQLVEDFCYEFSVRMKKDVSILYFMKQSVLHVKQTAS